MESGDYDFRNIEARWRQFWIDEQTFRTPGPGDPDFDLDKPKYYVLDMFPYTSGSGLHIGHPKGYIATDAFARYKRMRGFNVLHPMGFDSFGLPAEIYAIDTNVHPSVFTEDNIDVISKQFQAMGMGYDWGRKLATSDADYYRWTQWIFLEVFNSWFDPDLSWTDEAGVERVGRARPVDELIRIFESGRRELRDVDRATAGVASDVSWRDLNKVQKYEILNNYRLVYEREVVVNWCPGLGTVLANEEVTNEGRSERGDHPVYQRPLRQWIMRITAFADRLQEDLEAEGLPDGNGGTFALDWPDAIRKMQTNWIGRSEGAEVLFDVLDPGTKDVHSQLGVFTTRPDTLFGATFIVLAPEHPLVDPDGGESIVPREWPDATPETWRGQHPSLCLRDAVAAYARQAKQDAFTREMTKEKTGLSAGFTARNPVNGEELPVFIADYVSMEYGSGAIMAVPAHDERDYEFATQFGLPVVQVVKATEGEESHCFVGDGTSVNSPAEGNGTFAITGLPTAEAKRKMTVDLEAKGRGHAAVNYRLRDWVFSRQRYWGEPFPLARAKDGRALPVDIPVLLPEIENFQPEVSGEPNAPIRPPLARAPRDWRQVNDDGDVLERDYNVMPQWAGSCWYYLRFMDPRNERVFCDDAAQRYFGPVDLYIGGAEHAVLHLLYARFWHKVLYDLGHVATPEPFRKLMNQGMVTADAFADERGVYVDIREVEVRDGEGYHAATGKKLEKFAGKMGKRYKNGLPPEEVGEEYGFDSLRLYEMYMGPLEASAPWSMDGIRGMQRFLFRAWRNLIREDRTANVGGTMREELARLMHRTIRRVTDDLENLRMNTAIAALIELNNEMVELDRVPEELARNTLLMLAPFAPHFAEEVWHIAGFGGTTLADQPWPGADEDLARTQTVQMPVQVNGKVRARFEVEVDAPDEQVERLAVEQENVRKHLGGKTPRKIIVVPCIVKS